MKLPNNPLADAKAVIKNCDPEVRALYESIKVVLDKEGEDKELRNDELVSAR